MRVLVTGASGFIGARVVRALLGAGHDVRALLLPGDRAVRLDEVRDRIGVLHADLADAEAMARAIGTSRPEGCLHLAWYAEPGLYLHSPRNLDALRASLAMLEPLAAIGCRVFAAAGTCAEYEPADHALDEEAPTRPDTLYAACKAAFGMVGGRFARGTAMRFVWGRVFHLYGPGEDGRRMVPALIDALLDGRRFPATEGAQRRDYLHADDVARGFVALLSDDASGAYNICSGEPVTVRALMERVAAIAGRPDLVAFGAQPARDWDPACIVGDNRRLRGLGWSPDIALDAGLAAVLEERRQARAER